MFSRFILLSFYITVLQACTSTPTTTAVTTSTLVDTTSPSSANENIFGDNFDNKKKLYEIIFASILDSTYYKNPSLLIKRAENLND